MNKQTVLTVSVLKLIFYKNVSIRRKFYFSEQNNAFQVRIMSLVNMRSVKLEIFSLYFVCTSSDEQTELRAIY
ncbi:hypothetical protein T4B_12985 [Trichinella pseudospiralis]|uniref:Uncharacterized protein n=1 Tax=Trichinella pseudospiralis TaxID=6337 RepID=A0A0V1EB12_TRIPS|nr:hypothetical protein T4A_2281 [Trichinella pseudospiralis]KRZ20261.1 hypothetical protein T4B_12985 [Trichinella pseudospiralis]KRZ39102.1 hypothetical protein T4C_6449 [Trichinella pseudospiralis]